MFHALKCRSKRGSWSRSERKFQMASPLSKNHLTPQDSYQTAKLTLLNLSIPTHSPSHQLSHNPAKSQQLSDRSNTAVKKIGRIHQSWMWSRRNRGWSKKETWVLWDSLNVKNIRSTANHCLRAKLNKQWPATQTKQPRRTIQMWTITLIKSGQLHCNTHRERMKKSVSYQNLTAIPKM